jgi:hypothetical protein
VTENRANDWWRQAQNDLKFARATLRGKFHSQCCFVADSERSFPDRFRDFPSLGEGLPPMDVPIYTPAEWRRMRAHPSPLLRVAMAEWLALRA